VGGMIINTIGRKIFKDYNLTEHFKASEAFYLPKLGVYYIPTEKELANMLEVLERLGLIIVR
jgi:hypothetical protein